MTEAITFDFHNTLVTCDPWFEIEVRTLCSRFLRWRSNSVDEAITDDADRRYRLLRQAIIEHGNELTAEQCVFEILSEMNLTASDDEIVAGVQSIMMETLDAAEPVPGALDTVRQLVAAGYPLAIVSSAVYHPFLDASLAKCGFDGMFQSVVTSASSGFYKSRPEIYWTALDHVGVAPENAVHVGDSYRFDVLGGKRAGLGTVWLTDDATADAKLPAPDAIVPTLVGSSAAIRTALAKRR